MSRQPQTPHQKHQAWLLDWIQNRRAELLRQLENLDRLERETLEASLA